ncbi:MAG: DUF935 domain-containing protein [Bacteroidota bacterium]
MNNLIGVIALRNKLDAHFQEMPNPDDVLRKNNVYDIGRLMRLVDSDAHIYSCIQSRKAGVLSLEWQIEGDTNQETMFIESVFGGLDLRQIINDILNAPLFGYQPLEIYWRLENQKLRPVGLVAKPVGWFYFDNKNMLYFRPEYEIRGQLVPMNKFIIAQHYPTYDNPYGQSVLTKCFWPAYFKRTGLAYWGTYMEKFGMPYIIGKMDDAQMNTKEYDAFAEMLENLNQDAIAIIGEKSSIEIMHNHAAQKSDIYQILMQYCNAEISKAILSQTLTTEIGERGSYAASATHQEVRKDVIESDKKLVENALNQLIHLAISLNFGDYAYHPEFRLYEEEDVDMKLAERDYKLAQTNQIRFRKNYWVNNYGFAKDEIDEIDPAAQPTAAFADDDDESLADLDAQLQDMLENQTDDLVENSELFDLLIKRLDEHIGQSGNIEDALDALPDALRKLDSEALEELMTRYMFAAHLSGRASVSGEAENA